jgi:hypothetical protein
MSLLDLGPLDGGPVLVFGGPYSNLEATRALIALADRLGVPAARAICTGDVVAYCADPQATTDAVREWGCAVLMGNCEESLGVGAEDCGCGFEEGSACDRLSVAWYAYADAQLSADARRWMAGLPRRIRFSLAGRDFEATHGAPSQINRFVFASDPAADKEAELRDVRADAIVAGHCGIPFTQPLGPRLWHNAGVIGMPANDGRRETWASLLTPIGNAVEVRLIPLAYDWAKAAGKMRSRGLPQEYAASLETGLWPNCDILPALEARARGRSIASAPFRWAAEAATTGKYDPGWLTGVEQGAHPA